jgi:hypothetical protein
MKNPKHAINKLDEAYGAILDLVEDTKELEDSILITPILNKIDIIQIQLENYKDEKI